MSACRRWLAAWSLAGLSVPAFGQYCAQSDPNNPYCNEEAARREAELAREREQRERTEAYERQRERDEEAAVELRRTEPRRQEQARQSAETEAALAELRRHLLSTTPLPPDRNPLLGRWRIVHSGPKRDAADMDLLMGMLTDPGAAMCAVVFGEGTTEFLAQSWGAIDGTGNDSLGRIEYRMQDSRVFALPEKGIALLGFEMIDSNRIQEVRLPGCTLARVISRTTGGAGLRGALPGSTHKPVDQNSPLERGLRLHGEKNFQSALPQFLAAAESDPSDPRVFVYLADTYGWLGMTAESNQAAERARRLDPMAFEILR